MAMIKDLWLESKKYDCIRNQKELNDIAGTILVIANEVTDMTADEIEAVKWAKERLVVE